MKTLRIALLTILLLLGAAAVASYAQTALGVSINPSTGQSTINLGFFYDDLAPYGNWVRTPSYGWAWTPLGVAETWQPYQDGHWVWTDRLPTRGPKDLGAARRAADRRFASPVPDRRTDPPPADAGSDPGALLVMVYPLLKLEPSDVEVLKRAIPELVATNPNQLSEREYLYVADVVASRAARKGCNLLVFGVGRDSVVWLWVNREGRTVFLESSAHWAARVRAQIPWITICPVRYGSRLSQWNELLTAAPDELRLALPAAITETPWDVIFVDAPMGCDDRCPGRMQSIYTAAVLARRTGGVDVLVHDCDRDAESAFCDRFLGDALLVCALDRTRHYRTPPWSGSEPRWRIGDESQS